MRTLINRLLFILLVFAGPYVFAQEAYTISGIVFDEKHEPVKSATVFIGGTARITATDAQGRFLFGGMKAGNYSLSVQMLGYTVPSQTVTIHNEAVSVTFNLVAKAIALDEVKIGVDKNRDKYFALFKQQFLGTSVNAKNCEILNPEVIHYDSEYFGADILLRADADEFLIIENKQLGYRIKYLLKSFAYDSFKHLTFYQGENNFEELDGTAGQKKQWAKNRLQVYQGSLMHFLRAVFNRTVIEEGFITNQLIKNDNGLDTKLYLDPELVNFNALVSKTDSSFVSFKFTALSIVYNPAKAAGLLKKELKIQKKLQKAGNNPVDDPNKIEPPLSVSEINNTNSHLLLHLKEALIDARGSVPTGYSTTFLIRGIWANARIGDQLPFEYQPPEVK